MNAALLRTAALLALVLTAAACTEGSDQAERPPEAPAASPTGIGCPNEASAIATPRAESKGHLQGDVDGDGEEDEVFLIYERNARPGCRAFLILETEEQTVSAPIADWGDDAFVPELAFLTEVNGRRGREVIVKLGAGASIELFGMFTWQARELRRIDIRGWVHRGGFPIHDPSRDDLVVHGASAGHGDAVDCTRSNMVVISSAFPKKGGAGSNPYVIERRFYRPLPDAIVLARQDFAERPGTYAKDFFEFRSRPFQHCKSSKDLTSARRRDRGQFGIWPYDTYSEAKASCRRAVETGGWRTDLDGFVMRFASRVLGWEDARIEEMGAATGTKYAIVRRGPSAAGVQGRVILGVVDVVSFGPFTNLWNKGGPGCLVLSVLEPPPPSGQAPIGVRVRGRDVSVRFKRYDAASAQVIIGYGTHRDLRRTVTGGRASFRLPFKPDAAGHVIILLQDESRAVLTAAGITLRAGNLRFYWP